MSGKEMLEAMGHIEERLIHEAETVTPAKPMVWLRRCALAACLCIAVLGAFSLGRLLQGEGEAKNEALADDTHSGLLAPEYAVPDLEVLDRVPMEETLTATLGDEYFAFAPSSDAETTVLEIPTIALRIDAWQGDCFTATVTGQGNAAGFPAGTQLTVRLLPGLTAYDSADGDIRDTLPTEKDFPAGSHVTSGFFKTADEHTIWIASIRFTEKEDTP